MNVLNLYAGLGGNRKNWDGMTVTAVEIDPEIAAVYSDNFPDDTMIIGDAHEYLLKHYDKFDFIWSSPPCQSHSRMIRGGRNRVSRYPDLKLYEEILFLKHNFTGLYVLENVIPYYNPLVKPSAKLGRHLFWSNFPIDYYEPPKFKSIIKRQNLEAKKELMDWLGINYSKNIYYGNNHCPTQILRNCVHPSLGYHILRCAIKSQVPDDFFSDFMGVDLHK